MGKASYLTTTDTMMPSQQQSLLQITVVETTFVTTTFIITIFVTTSETVVLAAS